MVVIIKKPPNRQKIEQYRTGWKVWATRFCASQMKTFSMTSSQSLQL